MLGVDPGLAATGWGLLEPDGRLVGCGTVKSAPGPAGPRILHIVSQLQAVVSARAVAEAAVEELFVGRNVTSAIAVAQARGAILAALAAAEVPVFEYKPAQVKVALTGYGMAGKPQMARMLAMQVTGGGRMDDHAVDAVAIALCHCRSRRLRRALGQG